jgi:hypothetical protein
MPDGMPEDGAKARTGINGIMDSIGHALVIGQWPAKFKLQSLEKDGADEFRAVLMRFPGPSRPADANDA